MGRGERAGWPLVGGGTFAEVVGLVEARGMAGVWIGAAAGDTRAAMGTRQARQPPGFPASYLVKQTLKSSRSWLLRNML